MRAARLIEMLLVLQHRRQVTAGELAATLEVSERTILRDVEALSEAGVPIYAMPGAGGGIRLLDGFDAGSSGFTTPEIESLLLVGQTRLAERLGLGSPARTARHKLLDSLSAGDRQAAELLDEWLVADPDPWSEHRIPYGELRRIGRCVRERREVELRIGGAALLRVRPLGLVSKAGAWFLVSLPAGGGQRPEVLALDALVATRITRLRFTRPDGFDLGRFWDDHLTRVDGPTTGGPGPGG